MNTRTDETKIKVTNFISLHNYISKDIYIRFKILTSYAHHLNNQTLLLINEISSYWIK